MRLRVEEFKNLKTEAAGSPKLVAYLTDRKVHFPENFTESAGTTKLE
jgi:hypothetical protein